MYVLRISVLGEGATGGSLQIQAASLAYSVTFRFGRDPVSKIKGRVTEEVTQG